MDVCGARVAGHHDDRHNCRRVVLCENDYPQDSEGTIGYKEKRVKIAITTPNGHVGRKIAELLLADPQGHEIVLLPHNAEKIRDLAERGAAVREIDLSDREWVLEETSDIDTLFWVLPADLQTQDVVRHYWKIGGIGADAVRLNKIKHAVLLSSIGAHLGEEGRVGPIKGLKQAEEFFRFVTSNLVIVRPTYFMENLLMNLPSIAAEGKMYLPVSGEAKVWMIATRDIAAAIAGFIREPFTGIRVMPLHGPREYRFDEAADIIGKAIGKQVSVVTIPSEAAKAAMVGVGMSENMAANVVEMMDSVERGRLRPEQPHAADAETPTTLEQFAETVIAPAVRSMQKANT